MSVKLILGASLTLRTWNVTTVSENLIPSLALIKISTIPKPSSLKETTDNE